MQYYIGIGQAIWGLHSRRKYAGLIRSVHSFVYYVKKIHLILNFIEFSSFRNVGSMFYSWPYLFIVDVSIYVKNRAYIYGVVYTFYLDSGLSSSGCTILYSALILLLLVLPGPYTCTIVIIKYMAGGDSLGYFRDL